jgi:CelD/BcsL family acetyltransferase involved in cellulose biosynthesis
MPKHRFEKRHQNRRMESSGLLRHVALVRTDLSEELSASFIRVTRIDELGTTLALTSSRHTLRSVHHFLSP